MTGVVVSTDVCGGKAERSQLGCVRTSTGSRRSDVGRGRNPQVMSALTVGVARILFPISACADSGILVEARASAQVSIY
jgi:hypothetical protein